MNSSANRMLWQSVTAVLVLLLLSLSAHADSIDNLSQQLIKLRGQVEDLNTELVFLREEHKQRLSYLRQQQSEAESALDRDRLAVEKMRNALSEVRNAAAAAGTESDSLKPFILTAITNLKTQVRGTLPFKTKERLADLDELESQIKKNVLTPPRAANKLWSFVEDEIRLTKENGLFRQSIMLEGHEVLADVARLGMMMMYFRTADERFGKVQFDGGWSYVVINDDAAVEQVAHLFESLEKQVRTGFFELPNAIVAMEAN